MANNKPEKKAAFLDRDGTICEDHGYLSDPKDLKMFPFTAEAINLLIENDFLVILVTNQSGIARGYFTEDDFERVNDKIIEELSNEGASIDGVYYCPHAPSDKCHCRKPLPKMIERACRDFNVAVGKSWMIGDKAIDVETGINAGAKSSLVLTGYGKEEVEKCKDKADLVAGDLLDAVKKIIAG